MEWMQVPHYGYHSWVKCGFMGVQRNPNQRLWKLSDIIDKVREKTGIEWACLGFKQSDSLNRRLMLRSYKDGKESICWKGKKFYPLSTYKNADILEYIKRNNLKSPEAYGGGGQSCGCDVSDYWYLKYLQQNYPADLQKVYSIFPRTQFIIKEYEQEQARKQAEAAARKAAEEAESAQGDTPEPHAGDPAEPGDA
jgi:sulfate adenylyltransferase subunit 2